MLFVIIDSILCRDFYFPPFTQARSLGLYNGIWLHDAQAKAGPSLVVIPYDFDNYEAVSQKAYEVFLKYTQKIQVRPFSILECLYSDLLDSGY